MRDKKRFFTRSTTFDVAYLFDASEEGFRRHSDNKKQTREEVLNNSTIDD